MQPFLGLRNPLFGLSLCAIDPALKGVLIGGPSGSGKSVLGRAARSLFPENTPWVEIPLNVSIDRLLGEIDIQRTYAQKQRAVHPGLLAQAHGGVVFVDDINLLPPEILHTLLQALMFGEINLERQGISRRDPAKFTLIATFNPAERELPFSLIERVAFTTHTQTLTDISTRAFLALHAGSSLKIPPDIIQSVRVARDILPQVEMSEKHLREICAVASRTGVEGNRAEIFAVRCAKANAALHKRVPVTLGDVDMAIRLIFLPRVGESVVPGSENAEMTQFREEKQTAKPGKNVRENETQSEAETSGENAQTETGDGESARRFSKPNWKEVLLRNELLDFSHGHGEWKEYPLLTVKSRTSAGSGRHAMGLNFRRGRHIRSLPGELSRGRLDILATLKAAAISSAVNHPKTPDKHTFLLIRREDLRIRQYRQRMGLLFIFAVDASGSMAINRLNAARGAAISLLEHAYVYRDKVALIHFRDREAKLILSPGGGITKACRALQVMPAGGKTPLAAALLKTLEIAEQAPARWNVAGTVLVLLTDSRANQPLKPHDDPRERMAIIRDEILNLCGALRKTLSAAILFDARKIHVPKGRSVALANLLGAHYIFLPDANVHKVTDLVQSEVAVLRKI